MAATMDLQSELVILQLLDDDLRAVSLAEDARKINVDIILTPSVSDTESVHSVIELPWDGDITLGLAAADEQIARDQAFVELLQSQETSLAVSRQYAQKLAATEQKLRIDSEFARRLQDRTDDAADADSVLGQDVIEEILASDPNANIKANGRPSTPANDQVPSTDKTPGSTLGLAHIYPTCGICGDDFQDTFSPLSASLLANSSTRLPFGLRLPCPNQHTYCVGCLSHYIISKLDPDETGGAPEERIVFPIRCPECPLDQWTEGVQDDIAKRILTKDGIALWLLDSRARYYCPNRQCSALVQFHETRAPRATCPHCETAMCIFCKTQWHNELTCEEYQALPPDERLLEDRLLIQLAQVALESDLLALSNFTYFRQEKE
ncbi:hypothetical protein PILCRDRAFT_259554 [Piloderma croceum F 1598]|uniref:RBR-type E3 ubiquitin transferase n=1 Tax=Piloderma croceum (strain F 1598) TaxID=765440 RepID=A0A0C3BMP4_PILCF|nr:hypothetical protein PILCRDRAFT_259554 [Piloderma croceum F 1598]